MGTEADRRGRFGQHADILAVLAMQSITQAHPELRINFHVAETRLLTATTNGSKSWILALKDDAPGVTDVTLHNETATAEHLDDVWRIVEGCAAPR
jgi:hypothetical protein